MKTTKTLDLTGDDLLAAVAIALEKSYDDLSAQVATMDLARLTTYLSVHPEVKATDEERADVKALRRAILGSHEPLLPGENDLAIATEDDLWALCEQLLERYDINLSRRVELSTGRTVWISDEDNPNMLGYSPREAILRCYVNLKLGAEVTLDS